MSPAERTLTGLLIFSIIALGAAAVWFRLPVPEGNRGRGVPTATPTAAPVPTPSPTPVRAPAGYRLAGVAQSGTAYLAVIEAPTGRQTLHRVGDDVPGLGHVVTMDDNSVTIGVDGGDFVLSVSAAATPTPSRGARSLSSTPRRRAEEPARGSSPSTSPGRPVS